MKLHILPAVLALCACGGSDPDFGRSEQEIDALKRDADQDGYCAHERVCADPSVKPGDCRDSDATVHPGALDGEKADGLDNDCDGITDEDATDLDHDLDGWCPASACQGDLKPGDCDDKNVWIHPEAPEVFMDNGPAQLGVDNDCDGVIDNGTPQRDDDGDGFCEKHCTSADRKDGDCDDSNALVYPGAPEGEVVEGVLMGDGKDNNCDGVTDEGTIDGDKDGDGFCNHEKTCAKDGVFPGDCDDDNPLIFGASPEWQDIYDNDCDGEVNEEKGLAPIPDPVVLPKEGGAWATFEVYAPELYLARKDTWALDHKVDIATIDWHTGVLTLKRHNAPEPIILQKGAYAIPERFGPRIVVSFSQVDRESSPAQTYVAVLNFEERTRPVRMALIMEETPRPGLYIKSGWPIDGLLLGEPLSEHRLTSSPQGVSEVALASDPTQTTLFFWKCAEASCLMDTAYLGQSKVGGMIPKVLLAQPAKVAVSSVDVYDMEGCRKAYSEMVLALRAEHSNVEELFAPIQRACSTSKGSAPLPFTLIFTR